MDDGKPPRELIRVMMLEDGRNAYAVFCPGCETNLSRICLSRHIQTPFGVACEILHPVRCPECGYYLLEVPDKGRVIKPPG